MAALYNLARMTTATTGTGTVTLGSAVAGCLTFALSGVPDGAVVQYGIEDIDTPGREAGYGTYTASGTTLTRTVLKSTNSDAALSLSGNAHVAITALAENFREILTANRTYYVRGDGSNSNTGLANSAGGAFLTLQKAIDVVGGLDISVYDVTIKIGATGTYAGATVDGPFVGGAGSSVSIEGDTAAAGSYVISSAINVKNNASVLIRGVDFTSSARGLYVENGGNVVIDGAVIFGACTTDQIYLTNQARLTITSNYTIDGGAATHLNGNLGSTAIVNGLTITLTGTPAFSSVGHVAVDTSSLRIQGNTYSGSATGSRYYIAINGAINTNSGGASYLPGDSAGSTASGGQYV